MKSSILILLAAAATFVSCAQSGTRADIPAEIAEFCGDTLAVSCEPVLMTNKGTKTLNVDLLCQKTQRSRVAVTLTLIRDLSLMADKKDTVSVLTRIVSLPKRPAHLTVPFPFNVDPGFYEAHVAWTEEGGATETLEPFNIGCEPEEIVSEPDAPADFDEFWAANLAELAGVPMDAKLTLLPEHSNADRNVYRVEMKSLGGVTIGGILAEPVAEGTYPVYIDYMGYGAPVFYYDPSGRPDAIEFLVSVRDQGLFRDSEERWCDRGLDSRENYYYRGAFCDVVRAIDFVASLEKTDQTHIFARGESQGGAFTFVAASLDRRLRAAAPAVPFLGDYEDYGKIVWWPVWEIYEAAEAEGISRGQLLDMLRYFDVKNFTSKIECPIYMAFGLQDPTCPPHTNFSEYNQVGSEKQYLCVPRCGHAMWEIKEWAEKREAWFNEF